MLTRQDLLDNDWEYIPLLGPKMCYGKEKQDLYNPLSKGDYRIYTADKHPRIRVTRECCETFQTLFLGKCTNLATLTLIEELIGTKVNKHEQE